MLEYKYLIFKKIDLEDYIVIVHQVKEYNNTISFFF